jgi:hypothetical protein
MKYFILACMIFIISFTITAILFRLLYIYKHKKQKNKLPPKNRGYGN